MTQELDLSRIPEETSPKADLEFLLSDVKELMTGVQVRLPSNGPLYADKYKCDGTLTIYPILLETEIEFARIANEDKDIYKAILLLFQKCVKGISDPQVLTLTDKLFVLYKIRELSFGIKYTVDANCEKCKKKNRLTLDLTSLPVKYKEPGLSSLYGEIYLESAKANLDCRKAVFGDEQLLTNAGDVLRNLHKFVKTVKKGAKNEERRDIIEAFLKHLPQTDIQKIFNFVFDSEYGLDTNLKFECDGCKTINITTAGVNEHFFTAS